MKQIIISSETPENQALEKMDDKAAAAAVISDFICYLVYVAFLINSKLSLWTEKQCYNKCLRKITRGNYHNNTAMI